MFSVKFFALTLTATSPLFALTLTAASPRFNVLSKRRRRAAGRRTRGRTGRGGRRQSSLRCVRRWKAWSGRRSSARWTNTRIAVGRAKH